MGVVTLSDIDYGQIFGPFPVALAKADPATLIGLLTKDKHVGGIVIKIDPQENKETMRNVDWLPYIQPAREEDEQNVEAYMKDGYVYYRSLRIIKKDEELFVWYSKDFAQILGITEIQRNLRDDEPYICSRCGEVFEYPFCLRAHVRFRCDPRKLSILEANRYNPLQEKLLKMNERQEEVMKHYRTELSPLNHGREHNHVIKDFPLSLKIGIQQNLRKRPLEGRDESLSPKKPIVEHVPYPKAVSGEVKFSSENSENIRFAEGQEENRSAFTKVQKSHSPVHGNISSPYMPSKVSMSPPIAMTFPGTHYTMPAVTNVRMTSVSNSSNSATTPTSVQATNLYLPRYPIFPSFGITSNASQPLVENHSARRIMEMYKHGITPGSEGNYGAESSSSSSSTLMFPKHSVFHERSSVITYPFMKTSNPMVEKILQNSSPNMLDSPMTALSLSQNWCAKCNATFRMTSDLVYHMRSHHKREFDPVKRKREDKLKCSICNESFRERHHLTRHMTSHV